MSCEAAEAATFLGSEDAAQPLGLLAPGASVGRDLDEDVGLREVEGGVPHLGQRGEGRHHGDSVRGRHHGDSVRGRHHGDSVCVCSSFTVRNSGSQTSQLKVKKHTLKLFSF